MCTKHKQNSLLEATLKSHFYSFDTKNSILMKEIDKINEKRDTPCIDIVKGYKIEA